MIVVQKAENTNGVLLQGDFFDFDRLYFAIMKFTGFHGMDDDCTFPDCYDVCEATLGLCYEMRHAWQGDRDIVQMYNGIRHEWFSDNLEHTMHLDVNPSDSAGDDVFIDAKSNLTGADFIRFLRKDFPDVTESNAYFSVNLIFPEAVFYALVLSDLVKLKDIFILSRKRMVESDKSMKEINQEYLLFQAEQDVARIIIFVEQTFHALYRFIGEDNYDRFRAKLTSIRSFSQKCNLRHIMQLISDYGEKEYDQDNPEILTSTLLSFFNT